MFRVPPFFYLLVFLGFFCATSPVQATTAKARQGVKEAKTRCKDPLKALGLSKDQVEGESRDLLLKSGIDANELRDHVESVYLSMTGQGPEVSYNIRKLKTKKTLNDSEWDRMEEISDLVLQKLFRRATYNGKSFSQAEREVGEAEEVTVVTHLTKPLQAGLKNYLEKNKEKFPHSRSKWLFLVDPVSIEHLGADPAPLATLIEPSKGGEFNTELSAKKINIMGGYIEDCMTKTIHKSSTSALLDPASKSVDLLVHVEMSYMENDKSLASVRNKDREYYLTALEDLESRIKEEFDGDRHQIKSMKGMRRDGNPIDFEYQIVRTDGKVINIRFGNP